MDVPEFDHLLDAVCGAVDVLPKDVMNTGYRIRKLGIARRLFAGIARYSLGRSAAEISAYLGFKQGSVLDWMSQHNMRREEDADYFRAEGEVRQRLGLPAMGVKVVGRKCSASILDAIAHPGWTSAQDLALSAMRENGVSLGEIAIKLQRPVIGVTQRYHRLRVVPGVMEALMNDQGLSEVAA